MTQATINHLVHIGAHVSAYQATLGDNTVWNNVRNILRRRSGKSNIDADRHANRKLGVFGFIDNHRNLNCFEVQAAMDFDWG